MAIKPVDPDSSIQVIWPADPAIDEENSELEKYVENAVTDPGCWRELVKFKSGHEPTIFEVGAITTSKMAELEDAYSRSNGMNLFFWNVFLYSLRDIKNGPTVTTTDRGTGKQRQIVPKVKRNDLEYVDPEWLAKVFVRRLADVARHIGAFALAWNRLDDADIKK